MTPPSPPQVDTTTSHQAGHSFGASFLTCRIPKDPSAPPTPTRLYPAHLARGEELRHLGCVPLRPHGSTRWHWAPLPDGAQQQC